MIIFSAVGWITPRQSSLSRHSAGGRDFTAAKTTQRPREVGNGDT